MHRRSKTEWDTYIHTSIHTIHSSIPYIHTFISLTPRDIGTKMTITISMNPSIYPSHSYVLFVQNSGASNSKFNINWSINIGLASTDQELPPPRLSLILISMSVSIWVAKSKLPRYPQRRSRGDIGVGVGVLLFFVLFYSSPVIYIPTSVSPPLTLAHYQHHHPFRPFLHPCVLFVKQRSESRISEINQFRPLQTTNHHLRDGWCPIWIS